MRSLLALATLATLSSTAACTHHYQVASGRRLPDAQTDHVRGALEGAGVGLLVGAAGGAVVGYASGDDPPCSDESWFCLSFSAGEKAEILGVYAGGLGAVSGLVLGGLIGSRSVYEYADGPVPQVSVVATPGHASASATWRF